MNQTSAEFRNFLSDARDAYRRDLLPEAKAFLLKALEHEPLSARAHYLLANISLRQDDPATAEQHGRRAVELDGSDPKYHHTLVRALRRTGGAPAALDEIRQKARGEPGNFGAAYGLSLLLLETERKEEIKESLEHTRNLTPNSPEARLRVVRLYVSAKRYREASQLLAHMHAAGDDSAELHGMAGKCLLELKEPRKAARSYEKALRHTKAELDYHVGLSVARVRSGQPDEARRVTAEAIKRFSSATRAARNPEAQILVIAALGMGYFEKLLSGSQNFVRGNVIAWIPARRFTMHHILINHPDPVAVARSLGQIDLVFNNVANAEIAEKNGFTAKMREIVDALGVPVINAPEAIARTTRRENAETIPAKLGIFFPKTVRYSVSRNNLAETRASIRDEFPYPVLIRSIYTHADDNVSFVSDETALTESLENFRKKGVEEVYVIEYRTEKYSPKFFRKIRCALIDGKFFPVRADFSDTWIVHRGPIGTHENTLMLANPELMDSEHAYLRDPAGYVGAKNIARLEALARFLELDFVGVDFCLTRKGEIIIFEANPAMNAITDILLPRFPYFRDYWEQNLIAFEEMFLRRAGKLPSAASKA